MKIARDAEVWGVAIPQSLLDAERNAELRVPMDRVLSGALPHVTVPEERRAFVVSLFAELASLRGAPTVRIESLLVLLLAEFGAHMHHGKFQDAPHFARPDRDIAAQAVSFIAGSALGKLSLADVATALRRNRTHVADVVKRETGLTVGELIADFRLDEACRRLSETDELVEVIGERVGYADPTHFTRMFRRKFGVSPRAWRKANRQNLSAAR